MSKSKSKTYPDRPKGTFAPIKKAKPLETKPEAAPANADLPKFNLALFLAEGITDRDAPILHGEGKPRTLTALFEAKAEMSVWAPESLKQPYQVKAREFASANIHAKKPVVFKTAYTQNKSMPFLRAILDGVDFEANIFLRIVKTPYDGLIPQKHWIEMQHALNVVGFEKCYFVPVSEDETKFELVAVMRDPIFISNHVAECITFWDKVRRGEAPPPEVVDAPPVEEPKHELNCDVVAGET